MKNTWRVAAGIAVLAAFALTAIFLAPSYVRHVKLQQFLAEIAQDPKSQGRPAEMLQVAVADKAARLGIPLRTSQIRIDRSDGSLRIQARYIVRVDVLVYTVDLHFRARSGAR